MVAEDLHPSAARGDGVGSDWVTHSTTSLLEAVGMATSAGVTTGVFGFVAAHEMIHSRDRRERALGLALLGSVFYMHFRIAHVYGHHRRGATIEDPATARLGEGLYAFLVRSVVGQFREAWAFEVQRRRGNRMIVYLALEAAFLLVVALVSWRALAFVVAVAAIAVMLLESFNYVAHYGLARRIGADGRAERLAPRHSWNSGRRMNNASLFNMGRHSDHHRRMSRSYRRSGAARRVGAPAFGLCRGAADCAYSVAVAQDHGSSRRSGRGGRWLGRRSVKVVFVGIFDLN